MRLVNGFQSQISTGGDQLRRIAASLRLRSQNLATGEEESKSDHPYDAMRSRQAERCLEDLFALPGAPDDIEMQAHRLSTQIEINQSDPCPALGLADCAGRLGRTEEAYLFARESVRRGGKHPRAYCIMGVYELECGEHASAQHHLAVATRLARVRPDCRKELRIAQRLLLILHFGAGRSSPTSCSLGSSEESDS